MNLKVIACEVFFREVCRAAARSPNTLDLEFTAKDAHNESDQLRQQIQKHIDGAKDKYDAILLCYGLCGSGTVGLRARASPLVIPRAHDCCTIFLGSRLKYKQYFADNPSRPYSSLGYMERGSGYINDTNLNRLFGLDKTLREHIDLYGEDNASYIRKHLHEKLVLSSQADQIVYIEIPENKHLGWSARFKARAAKDGKEFIKLRGSGRLIQNLIDGSWDAAEYLYVPPRHTIEGVYDWDEICRAVKTTEGSLENQ